MDTIICQDCGKEFTKIAKLQRHVREIHMNLKPFKCEFCDKGFKRKFHLTRHMVSHSDNPKPFSCIVENCTQRFSNKHHLTRHIKIVHDQDRYRCKICDTVFKKKNFLKKHIKEAHYTLYNQDELDLMNIPVESEQPFLYEEPVGKKLKIDDDRYQFGMVCNSTKDSEYIIKDLDFNLDDLLKVASESLPDQKVKPQPRKVLYKCPYDGCFKSFSMLNTLRSHIKASHLKVKSFKCDQPGCDAKFCHKGSLTRHSLKKHTNPPLINELTGLPSFEAYQQNDFQSFIDFGEEDYTSFLASSPLRLNLSLQPDLLEDF